MRNSTVNVCVFLLVAANVLHLARAQQWEMSRVGNQDAACAYDVARGRTVVFGGFGGTREFDGQRWTGVSTAHSPPRRIAPTMTYDILRRRVVLVGGSDPVLLRTLRDTWEYDGVDWRQVVTAHSPDPVYAAITYDWFRGVVVLYDGRQETWEYDGIDWTQRFPAVSPPIRAGHQIAFQLNGRTLLFGGGRNDTWEYDGAIWRQVFPTISPPPRAWHGMAYDVARDCVVVHAGYELTQTDTWEYRQGQWSRVDAGSTTHHLRRQLVFDWRAWRMRMIGFGESTSYTPIQAGETWEYDGRTWAQSALAPHPSPRRGHVMVHDPVRSTTLLFGGLWPWRNDTWEYVGGNWSSINTTSSPSPRAFASAVYDASSGSILMFGGDDFQSVFDDTWRFDGQDWRQVATAVRPPARSLHAMAYDPARRRIVLFGGSPSGISAVNLYNDTWEFDGQQWSAITPQSSPRGRCNHAMAYDASRSRIVLFGGIDYYTRLVDTWEYDGSRWSYLQTNGGPDIWRELGGLRMIYDAPRGKLLLLGQGLWELDGSTWRSVTTPNDPSFPMDAGWVATPGDGVHLFGGVRSGSNSENGDEWWFHAAETPSWTRHGAGCGASAPTLDVATPPGSLLGTTVNVRIAASGADTAIVVGGFDVWQWNGAPLPLPLDQMPAPGCELWIAPTAGAEVLPITGGLGNLAIPIPADPSLAGWLLCLQAMTGDTAVGASSLALTNAGVLRVY